MSDVLTMIVSDSNGKTSLNKGNIVLKDEESDFYIFYAVTPETKEEERTSKDVRLITLTMPIGGEQNGLLRLPRVGENILVIQQGNQYFLMSYIPNKDMDFRKKNGKGEYEKSSTKNEALTLRYKSPNPLKVDSSTKGDNICSEIKFSTDQTYWGEGEKVKVTKEYDGAGYQYKDAEGNTYAKAKIKKDGDQYYAIKQKDCPNVDRLDVSSTGDIFTTAGNFNEITARRVGIFSGRGTDQSLLTKDCLQGDILASAKHRIVIDADDQIVLQCGRSSIIIDDAGISIKSAKVDPKFSVADDSQIILSSRTGVAIGGSNVSVNANSSFSISESCGGSISSMAGMTRIGARDVQVASKNTIDAGTTFVQNIINYSLTGSAYDMALKDCYTMYPLGSSIVGSVANIVTPLVKFKMSDSPEESGNIHIDEHQYESNSSSGNNGRVVIGEDAEHKKTYTYAEGKKFTKGSQATCVGLADIALVVGNLLLKTSNLVFTCIEGTDRGTSTESAKILRDKCNKASYWANQTIIDAVNAACFIGDVFSEMKGARINTAVATSSIRFHGGYGDIACSSIDERGVQKISGISPTAGSRLKIAGYVLGTAGFAEDIANACVANLDKWPEMYEELRSL